MMKRIFLAGVVIVVAVAVLGALYVLRDPEEASGSIQAVPLTEEQSDVADGTETLSIVAQDAHPDADNLFVFEISQADSQARFDLEEDLRGVRTTVVGVTDQVAGQIALNPSDLSTVQVGTIQINARTLTTDNSFRNRAIQNEILDTGSYEYITFTPTSVDGLPDSVGINETVSFTMAGDLTIRDVTQSVTFHVTATFVSATELSGTASATIARQDYNLTIPSVPQVANVDEEVQLVIDFTAVSS